jgi:hypothetical protein
MRKILLGLFLIISSIGFSQTYKFGALGTAAYTSKVIGTISINDKKVLIETEYDGKKKNLEYDLIRKTNGLIYFTDGVMTNYFSFVDQKGTKKGFDYDVWVVFNFDKSQSTQQIIYYCKLQE